MGFLTYLYGPREMNTLGSGKARLITLTTGVLSANAALDRYRFCKSVTTVRSKNDGPIGVPMQEGSVA